MILGIVRSLKN